MASSRKRNDDVLDGNRKRTNTGEFDGSYEIKVITDTNEITLVMVKDSDTVSQIERMIHGKNKSSNPALINIFIKNFEGKIMYYLEVKPSDTIGNLKVKMCNFAQVLVFNGAVLEDSGTLADFSVVNGSTLTRIDKLQAKMEIFVNTFTKKTISLSVAPTDTIGHVKQLIEYKERVPVDEQVLIFNGMALEDSGTLFNFYIQGKSTLTLVRRSKGLMDILVETFEGKFITVEVHPSTTIGDVKSKIEDEVDIPHDEQELIFNETVLANTDTIANCNINEESTVTLVRISTGHMHIFIKNQDGVTTTLKVKPSTTVNKMKSKYANLQSILEGNVKFIFEGRLMEDRFTLADYHVHNESTIDSMLHLTGD